jgi:KAP family P-loop domain
VHGKGQHRGLSTCACDLARRTLRRVADDNERQGAPSEIPLWPDNPTAQDLVGFADIAEPVSDAVRRERLDPVAVGIFGDWGSGKTTILEILSERFEAGEGVVVVCTRPWEYDPGLDPKATLIAEVLGALAEEIKKNETRWNKVKSKFGDLAKRVQWSKAITLVTKSAMSVSVPSIDDVVGLFSAEGGDETADPTLQGFRNEFAKLMAELDEIDRVVVLVDDLDRCLPETVVSALEAIKLFLSVEKMAFVLAADRRLVELAIAERFGASAQAPVMAREYLEKIVQIPISVPALGLGDTEAYLAMMLVERHLPGKGEDLAKIIECCDERRRSAQERIFEGLGDLVPDAAKDDVALASYLAPVLYHRLGGNPRRLKRFLNAFWVRSAVAEKRGASLEPTALAKLMVLEQLAPDAFDQLIRWLGEGTLGEKLRILEEEKKLPDEGHEALDWWRTLPPDLRAVPLGPYLRLAATLRSHAGPRSDLRIELREVLDGLHAAHGPTKNKARKKLEELPEPDRQVLAREITELMRVEPETQADLGRALPILLKHDATIDQTIDGLRRLDPPRIDPAVIVALGSIRTDRTHPVLREWLESGRLGEVSGNAAASALAEGES